MLAIQAFGEERFREMGRLRTLYEAAGIPARGVNLLVRKGITPEDLAQTPDRQLLRAVTGLGVATLGEIRRSFPALASSESRLAANTRVYTPGQWEWLAELAERQGFADMRLSDLPALVRTGQFGDPALLLPRGGRAR